MGINPEVYGRLQKRTHSVPGLLWHYTTNEGLTGIVNSETLWAFSASALNDYEEIRIGRERIAQRLLGSGHATLEDLWQKTPLEEVVENTFIASLSTEFDDLSQWRGYATARQGFAVGIDYARLAFSAERERWGLLRCVYDSGEQERLIQRFFADLDEARRLANTPDGNLDESNHFPPRSFAPQYHRQRGYGMRQYQAIEDLEYMTAQFKHHGFYKEGEYRLVLRHCQAGDRARVGLTRFSGHLSVYREGVSNGEQRNEVSSGVSQANGRIGLGGPQIRGPVQGVWSNGLDDPKMGQASRARC
jgi:hypothetical protein